MSGQLSIRAATEADLPAVLNLYAQPGLDDGAVLPLDKARVLFGRFACYPDYTLYVAVDGEVVVGTFALLIMDNLGHLGAPSGVVEDVAVDPQRQAQGIGRQMLSFARDVCAAKACYKMALSANKKRQQAHRFYESLGLTQHGYSFIVELNASAERAEL